MCAKHSTPLRTITQISSLMSLYDKRLWFNFLTYLEGKIFLLWISCKSHKTSQACTPRSSPLGAHGSVERHTLRLFWVPTPPQTCLGRVEVWHRRAQSSMPKLTPLGAFILFFFLSQATQRIIQPQQKLFSTYQNYLGNCKRGHTSVRTTYSKCHSMCWMSTFHSPRWQQGPGLCSLKF